MDEEECEGMRKEGKVKSRITKQSGTNRGAEQRARDNVQDWLREFVHGNLWDPSLYSIT